MCMFPYLQNDGYFHGGSHLEVLIITLPGLKYFSQASTGDFTCCEMAKLKKFWSSSDYVTRKIIPLCKTIEILTVDQTLSFN